MQYVELQVQGSVYGHLLEEVDLPLEFVLLPLRFGAEFVDAHPKHLQEVLL